MQDKSKPILFTMARLDRVKNLTGLVEWYANNPRLRNLVNLVIVGGIVDSSQTSDRCVKRAVRPHCHGVIMLDYTLGINGFPGGCSLPPMLQHKQKGAVLPKGRYLYILVPWTRVQYNTLSDDMWPGGGTFPV